MIRKLLLVRVNKVTSDFIPKNKLDAYVKGDPIPFHPGAKEHAGWTPEAGPSHWGYVLEMKLKECDAVKKWNNDPTTPEAQLIEMDSKKPVEEALEEVLKGHGLTIYLEDDEDAE